jgi:catechol 2,3-dioxygenase-like lactoylglutathione lyase family enzyme
VSGRPGTPLHHVGIVVRDIAAARRELSEQLDVAWGPVLHLDTVEYRDGAGHDRVLPTTMCYSVDAPHLELILEVPGSIWQCNETSNLHHIGFWSGDLAAHGDDLVGSGCPLQFCGRSGDDAPVSFAYHGSDLGVRIEIVDAAMREAMAFLFLPDEG